MDFSLFVVSKESHNVLHQSPHCAPATSLNHILSIAAESGDRANRSPSQETSVSHSQPGVEKHGAAQPDVVDTGEFTERSCLSLLTSRFYVSQLVSVCFCWRGPCPYPPTPAPASQQAHRLCLSIVRDGRTLVFMTKCSSNGYIWNSTR